MKKNVNKKCSFILKGIKIFIIVFAIFIIFINLNILNAQNTKISTFNKVGIAVVASSSMEPVLSINDLIVINKKNNYNVGDIIVYRSNNEMVIHRIVRMNQYKIVTKGDANDYEDKPINYDDVYGKLSFAIPYVGTIVTFFKSSYGIFGIIALVVIMFIYSCNDELKKMGKK